MEFLSTLPIEVKVLLLAILAVAFACLVIMVVQAVKDYWYYRKDG